MFFSKWARHRQLLERAEQLTTVVQSLARITWQAQLELQEQQVQLALEQLAQPQLV